MFTSQNKYDIIICTKDFSDETPPVLNMLHSCLITYSQKLGWGGSTHWRLVTFLKHFDQKERC